MQTLAEFCSVSASRLLSLRGFKIWRLTFFQEFEKKLNLLRDRASDLFALTPNKPDAEHEKRIQQQISALEDTEIINVRDPKVPILLQL